MTSLLWESPSSKVDEQRGFEGSEMLGAIIITTEQSQPVQSAGSLLGSVSNPTPWAAAEVLGKTLLRRLAERLKETCDLVSVISSAAPEGQCRVEGQDSPDVAAECFARYKQKGCEAVLVARCGAYVDLDVESMFAFHREQAMESTCAFAADGPLDFWIVDPSAVAYSSIFSPWFCDRCAVYHSHAYVNRLQSARDFRRLVLDSFHSRCLLRPNGLEIKPGIWVCEGAQIERSARIVAPAFIGRNVEISDECLITRGSNVEHSSCIDFGTAIENSAILPNTYVGIGLDLSHSIVDGRNLLNLQHEVNLQIADPVVLRRNPSHGRERKSWADTESGMALSSVE
jgi:carbonic anhydrase/acetyltransferase-like protein (isoleucine patch superfamily)